MKTVRLTSSGDMDIQSMFVTGSDMVKQNVIMYFKTKRNSFTFDQDYGSNVTTVTDKGLLKQMVRSELEAISGVYKVLNISVSIDRNSASGTYSLILDYYTAYGDRLKHEVIV